MGAITLSERTDEALKKFAPLLPRCQHSRVFNFLRKEQQGKPLEALHFKSGEAAYEYAVEYMKCPLLPGSRVYGLVEAAYSEDDQILCDVKIANKERTLLTGGISLWEEAVKKIGLNLASLSGNDFVVIELIEEVPGPFCVWAFIVMGRVKPIWSFDHNAFLPDLPDPDSIS